MPRNSYPRPTRAAHLVVAALNLAVLVVVVVLAGDQMTVGEMLLTVVLALFAVAVNVGMAARVWSSGSRG